MAETMQGKIDRLGNLYTATGEDWCLSASVILTEPVCPIASVYPESFPGLTRYAAWGDTMEDAISKACDAAYTEIVLGKKIAREAPWTNPDDVEFEKKYGSGK